MERVQNMAIGRFAIEEIVMRYAEVIDLGDIESLGPVFAKASIKMPDGNTLTGAEEICDHYRNLIIFYDSDGNVVPYQRGECTPRTRHVITNLVFDFDNAVKAADVRSYFTAYQTIGDRNEIIAGGRYVDHFELDLQGWHIVEREIFLDNQGDMSQHLTALFE